MLFLESKIRTILDGEWRNGLHLIEALINYSMMQARLRGVKSLTRFAQRMMRPLVPVRVFSAEATQTQDVYEHMSNMKTKDLFQFEPFSSEDLLVSAFMAKESYNT